MRKKIVSLTLAILLVNLSVFASPSNWAKKEVERAKKLSIATGSLLGDYQKKITRDEFCSAAIDLFSSINKTNLLDYAEANNIDLENSAFNDTSEPHVILANKLGFVSGRGKGKFDPNANITRQEAAKMLANIATSLKVYQKKQGVKFQDAGKIASWAKESIDFTSNTGIMKGVSATKFSPLSNYTREQTFATLLRLRDFTKDAYSKAGKWAGLEESDYKADKDLFGVGDDKIDDLKTDEDVLTDEELENLSKDEKIEIGNEEKHDKEYKEAEKKRTELIKLINKEREAAKLSKLEVNESLKTHAMFLVSVENGIAVSEKIDKTLEVSKIIVKTKLNGKALFDHIIKNNKHKALLLDNKMTDIVVYSAPNSKKEGEMIYAILLEKFDIGSELD